MRYGYALFQTGIGGCGIAWGPRGIVAVQLPEEREADTRARVRQRCPEAPEAPPPPEVRRTIGGIQALLRGEPADLSSAVLDMEGLPPFQRRVYGAARTIPPGQTVSYGELAAGCGAPGAARAVGQALGRNPFPIVVPCHRVLAAGGRAGGFSAHGGVATKMRLLSLEAAAGAAAGSDAGGPAVGGVPVAPRAAAHPAPGAEGGPAPAETGARPSQGPAGFRFDPEAALAHLRAADPDLARLIDAVGTFQMELQGTASLFSALAQAIVYQQLSGRAAATIFGRVRALFPETQDGPTAEQVLGAPDEALRQAGLSRGKILALRDLAGRVASGDLPSLAETRGMEDAAVIERLTRVRGIGRWTAEMFLMFRLGRPDVLPLDDYGLRRGFAAALGLAVPPARAEIEARGERWRPYRTVASWYLWRAAERPGG